MGSRPLATDFREVELEMIRRGDMLGPELGARVFAALVPVPAAASAESPGDVIRVCPERDARCPHGTQCPYAVDRYRCDAAGTRADFTTGKKMVERAFRDGLAYANAVEPADGDFDAYADEAWRTSRVRANLDGQAGDLLKLLRAL